MAADFIDSRLYIIDVPNCRQSQSLNLVTPNVKVHSQPFLGSVVATVLRTGDYSFLKYLPICCTKLISPLYLLRQATLFSTVFIGTVIWFAELC